MNNHLSDKTSFLNSPLGKGGLRGVFFICAAFLVFFLFASSATAVTSLTYEYDANGNLIRGDGKYYEYNDANQLVRVKHGDQAGPVVAEYVYDYTGQRIKKVENGITTYYIGKHFEKQVDSDGTATNTSYYFANNERVAKKDSSGNVYYYHSDHLGGTNVVTDSSGSFIERIRYYPFGEIREGGNEKYSFTGKEKDKLTDFYYYEARYYNPEFKHFTQADTIEPDMYDPQDLNRYAYVRNNPETFIDPDGQRFVGADYKYVKKQIDKSGSKLAKAIFKRLGKLHRDIYVSFVLYGKQDDGLTWFRDAKSNAIRIYLHTRLISKPKELAITFAHEGTHAMQLDKSNYSFNSRISKKEQRMLEIGAWNAGAYAWNELGRPGVKETWGLEHPYLMGWLQGTFYNK